MKILPLITFVTGIAAGWGLRAPSENSHAPSIMPRIGTASVESRAAAPLSPARPFRQGAAKDWVLHLPHIHDLSPDDQNAVPVDLAHHLLTLDDFAAREAAETVRDLMLRSAAQDPSLEAELQNASRLHGIYSTIVYVLTQKSPQEAVRCIKLAPEAIYGERAEAIFENLVTTFPPETLLEGFAGWRRNAPFAGVFRGLLAADRIQEAIALVHTLPLSENYVPATAVLRRQCETGFTVALATAQEFDRRAGNGGFAGFVFNQWATRDQAAATAARESYAGPGAQAIRAGAIAGTVNEDLPSAIAAHDKLIAEGASAGDLGYATHYIMSAYLREDPAAAAAWASGLPLESVRASAMEEVAGTWTRSDPDAASVWVNKLPAGKLRDEAAGALASSLTSQDPEAAVIWAQSIRDPESRHRTVKDVFWRWLQKDASAALTAMQALPASDQAGLPGLPQNDAD